MRKIIKINIFVVILSLLSTFSYAQVQGYQSSLKLNSIVNYNKPVVMTYWPNWSVYLNESEIRAVPNLPYLIPSSFANPVLHQTLVKNPDFINKMHAINIIAYAFLQAQTRRYSYYNLNLKKFISVLNRHYQKQGGTLYFSDPWADLGAGGNFCNHAKNPICWYVYFQQKLKPNNQQGYGSFKAFLELPHALKIISIGGAGHDRTFEDAFNSRRHAKNFVASALAIMNAFYDNEKGLVGFDLDYENLHMTHKQSLQYAKLVKRLNKALKITYGKNHYVLIVTILPAPNYILGKIANDTEGFSRKALKIIAKNTTYINLMTYNFSGVFDYNTYQTGKTGFLTNVFPVPQHLFSIQASVNALQSRIQSFVKADHILVGIPAYGYAIANINSNQQGLNQKITKDSKIVRGNLDIAFCQQRFPLRNHSCHGAFGFRYIEQHMLHHGFKQKNWILLNKENATSAYAKTWTTQKVNGAKNPMQVQKYHHVFLSYCSPKVAATVTDYVKKQHLGGIMLWQITTDSAFSTQKNHMSLLGAIYATLNGVEKSPIQM